MTNTRPLRLRYFSPLVVATCVATTVLGGCSRPLYGQNTTGFSDGQTRPDPQVRPGEWTSENPRAHADFETGVRAWRAGRYTEAADRFRFFVADHPTDVLAVRAELWLARTLVASGDLEGGRRVLRDLQAHGPTDEARATAALYLAFAEHISGNAAGARRGVEAVLQNHPRIHVVEGQVVEGDTPLLSALLADTRLRRSAFQEALRDLEVVERSATDEGMRAWAVASAMTVAREALPLEQVDALVRADSTFQRAIAVGAAVQKHLAAGRVDAAAGAFQSASAALLAHDLSEDFAALQNSLALRGSVTSPMYGVAISLTGPDRRAGRAALGGMLLAQRSFEGGARTSDMWIEDTAGTASGARIAVQRLCERGVPLIVGPIEAGLAAAAREAALACGATYIGLETVSGSSAGGTAWRMSFSALEEARALAQAAARHGALRIAIVTEDPLADFLEQVAQGMREEGLRQGLTVIAHERVNTKDLQASSRRVATALKRANPTAIVFAVSSTTATALTSYLAAEGIWPEGSGQGRGPVFLASSFVWSAGLAANSSRYVEGMYVASWLPPTSPIAGAFSQAFERTFGRAPGALEAFAYDAASFSRRLVLDEGARDGVAIRQRLMHAYTYDGVTGRWRWEQGELLHPPTLLRVKNGTLESP